MPMTDYVQQDIDLLNSFLKERDENIEKAFNQSAHKNLMQQEQSREAERNRLVMLYVVMKGIQKKASDNWPSLSFQVREICKDLDDNYPGLSTRAITNEAQFLEQAYGIAADVWTQYWKIVPFKINMRQINEDIKKLQDTLNLEGLEQAIRDAGQASLLQQQSGDKERNRLITLHLIVISIKKAFAEKNKPILECMAQADKELDRQLLARASQEYSIFQKTLKSCLEKIYTHYCNINQQEISGQIQYVNGALGTLISEAPEQIEDITQAIKAGGYGLLLKPTENEAEVTRLFYLYSIISSIQKKLKNVQLSLQECFVAACEEIECSEKIASVEEFFNNSEGILSVEKFFNNSKEILSEEEFFNGLKEMISEEQLSSKELEVVYQQYLQRADSNTKLKHVSGVQNKNSTLNSNEKQTIENSAHAPSSPPQKINLQNATATQTVKTNELVDLVQHLQGTSERMTDSFIQNPHLLTRKELSDFIKGCQFNLSGWSFFFSTGSDNKKKDLSYLANECARNQEELTETELNKTLARLILILARPRECIGQVQFGDTKSLHYLSTHLDKAPLRIKLALEQLLNGSIKEPENFKKLLDLAQIDEEQFFAGAEKTWENIKGYTDTTPALQFK